MAKKRKQSGFSLTEVLMAVGILSIGMMLVATMFPVGMHLTAVAAERTISAVVADEAFAKIRLYSIDINDVNENNCTDFNDVVLNNLIDSNEFAYPAMEPNGTSQYYWSALCRKVNSIASDRSVQVIVFVSRKRGAGLTYQGLAQPALVKVDVNPETENNKFNIINSSDERLINSGSVIVDNTTGQIYRVIERGEGGTGVVTLGRDWDYNNTPAPDKIWVIAPPDAGGANPTIAVFQKIIKF